MTLWIRNTRGRPDALLTFSAGAVAVVLVKVLLNGAVVFGHQCGTIDASLAGVVLAATVGAYGWKRTTVDKGHGTELPPTVSTTLSTRGFAQLPQIVFLVAVGFALFLYAMAHRGSP